MRLSSALAVLLLSLPSFATAERLQVRLATLEWPPYVGASLTGQGYAAQVIRTACERRGVDVTFDLMPWARALMLGLRGDVAGVMPEYRNAQREAEFAFSAPFPGGPVGLYKRHGDAIAYAVDPGRDLDAALRSVARHRIGIVRDYINNTTFDRADYLDREEAANDSVNLRKLAHGRVDLVFVDRWVAEYLLQNDPLLRDAKIEMLQPPIEEPALHVAWSRQSEAAAAARPLCDEGFAELQREGTIDRLRERHGLAPKN
ncbi:MAG TPA: transporter substrate-binding domain-containing protein [Tahibacter sp.]|uniref:substrate-binding periplasmic protein n=1 Tax=Tahibacter sp. TaxID=2056211 RepID=UPI002BF8DB8B|nr:transporter substrate-binding domain-containing protein [Tahibacter sp.]HSX61729.1 transporter substrate-binding domain-containing protein [Tahibacter sp.]